MNKFFLYLMLAVVAYTSVVMAAEHGNKQIHTRSRRIPPPPPRAINPFGTPRRIRGTRAAPPPARTLRTMNRTKPTKVDQPHSTTSSENNGPKSSARRYIPKSARTANNQRNTNSANAINNGNYRLRRDLSRDVGVQLDDNDTPTSHRRSSTIVAYNNYIKQKRTDTDLAPQPQLTRMNHVQPGDWAKLMNDRDFVKHVKDSLKSDKKRATLDDEKKSQSDESPEIVGSSNPQSLKGTGKDSSPDKEISPGYSGSDKDDSPVYSGGDEEKVKVSQIFYGPTGTATQVKLCVSSLENHDWKKQLHVSATRTNTIPDIHSIQNVERDLHELTFPTTTVPIATLDNDSGNVMFVQIWYKTPTTAYRYRTPILVHTYRFELQNNAE
eukprot:386968_1